MTPLFDTITLSMIKRLTFSLLLTCLYVPCFSQERFVVRGRILDAESAPVPYCSVSILESRDSTILGGAVSDTEGRYSLHFEQAGRYLLCYDHLAYESCYRTVEVPEAQTLPDVILRPASRHIDEVVVVAKSRTVAERMGKIRIDFVIELPRQLQGNCQSVAVTPMLHKTDSLVPLQQISIRGGLFSRVQDRNYWQFDQYVRIFKPDAAAEQRAFERFVKHPYPEGVRLDSIVEGREKISYYYTQEVPTKGEGKTMHVTLEGAVVGLDGSRYDMPPLDTLEYNISSMLTFTDTTRRYLIKVIEKYAVVKDRNYLAFKVGKSDIIDTLETNAVQLARIESLMDGLINQREFYVDSIVLTASASPEGALALNERLARERALSLKRRLGERFGRQVDTLIAVRSVGENWTELGRLIAASDSLPHREAILALLGAEKNPDRREAALRGRYPQEYKYIRERLYPLLRSVDFKYDLRRVGMVKDTIHTTVPDTLYARGVKLLDERRYDEALTIFASGSSQNNTDPFSSVPFLISCHNNAIFRNPSATRLNSNLACVPGFR